MRNTVNYAESRINTVLRTVYSVFVIEFRKHPENDLSHSWEELTRVMALHRKDFLKHFLLQITKLFQSLGEADPSSVQCAVERVVLVVRDGKQLVQRPPLHHLLKALWSAANDSATGSLVDLLFYFRLSWFY